MKVVIEVRGGSVTDVWSTDAGTEVVVRDFDNIESGGKDPITDEERDQLHIVF